MSSSSSSSPKDKTAENNKNCVESENDNSNNNNNNNNVGKETMGGPPKKKAKTSVGSPTKQTTLHQFFTNPSGRNDNGKSSTIHATPATAVKEENVVEAVMNACSQSTNDDQIIVKKEKNNSGLIINDGKIKAEPDISINKKDEKSKAHDNNNNNDDDDDVVPDPVIPRVVAPDPKSRWKVVEDCMIVRYYPKEAPRTKAAVFDVDGTLLVWRISGWPSRLEHYELWNTALIAKLRHLHDHEQYKLVLVSNQGAIRTAMTGKKATHVKAVMEWIAHTIGRPVHIVMSTNKKMGYHKPSPGMWTTCENHCNKGGKFNIQDSFFVGDSIMSEDDPQGGVDEQFAKNVGKINNATLKFYTPQQYFGRSDSEERKQKEALMGGHEEIPLHAVKARRELLGGYLQGPIVLLLCGVQGSGKSTFCKKLFANQDEFGAVSDSDSEDGSNKNKNNNSNPMWVHLSQDTINNGKPGKREAVEEKTRQAIQEGRSVVVDRTHLDADQRKHFVDIAKKFQIPAHILVFQTPKEVVAKRVKERTDHPGGVEGEKGVRVAMIGMSKMCLPTYLGEGFDLISCVKREDSVQRLSDVYRQVIHVKSKSSPIVPVYSLKRTCTLSCGTTIPVLALGTMKVGKRVASDVVSRALRLGFRCIDTAPTYENETVVGEGINNAAANSAGPMPFVIVKVPKRASQPEQVFEELEASLRKLKIKKADLLLLHWPCDVIVAGTLKSVWQAMEKCVADGRCRALGVCNFTIDALCRLLPHCTIPPAVNQVERHPLLPQFELLDFCINHDIILQAHTPLGQSTLLSNESIIQVAKKAKLTTAQVLLKWNLQHGVPVVCKCTAEDHQRDVLAIFGKSKPALRAEEMKVLDAIAETEKRRFVSPPFMDAPGNVFSWKK